MTSISIKVNLDVILCNSIDVTRVLNSNIIAVWDCSSSKSPGPDGLNFKFIKRYWAIIRFEFFNFIKYFEKFGCLARGCNASFIVLIQENSDPVDLGDYRPISLIGCMYKVLSKLLSRRLCKVIHKLIRPNQTAFLSGRQILDGILIANEIVNYAKKEKLKLLLFKVDFEKAFDSVNRKFLIDIMSQMGFSAKWCKWIHACLSSASISVLINGSPSKEFSMERGLRQGDPLSPFLFLIIAEALQVMMTESCNNGIFKGLFLAKNDTNISLLQYADDAIFFGEWSKTNALCLVNILKCFHDISVIIAINLDTSSDNNTSEKIDYDSPEYRGPPKSLLKWYGYLSDEYKDKGGNKSDAKPSFSDISKAKACMLAKA
ncbi:cysteine-rich receptor-like protein kinase [Tanacetum coccineum]|uniref:Cysteine-rich receptor-like protein kinase n=1 Tax=Tanacetum coccineum TaxID=301880 RepID=A0ABQ5HGN0_9ASTR